MSQTNASDLCLQPVNDAGLFLLPTRGEKRIIPVVTPSEDEGDTALSFTAEDFDLQAALSPYFEYVSISIPGRGTDASGNPDPAQPAVFQFLVNPEQVQISRQQADAQAMARSGWQIGVWGEDFIVVTLEGKTPGKYFSNGLTDLMTEYTVSYRNLVALELVVENNGYWFEGEQAAEGPLASSFTRRQIKMHSDVQMTMAEFIWFGMFESMEISEDADTPFLMNFSLTFIAWREHFRSETPYSSPIGGAMTFGHTPEVSMAYGTQSDPSNVIRVLNTAPSQLQVNAALQGVISTYIPPSVSLSSAAIQPGASAAANLPAIDATPVSPITSPTNEQWNLA